MSKNKKVVAGAFQVGDKMKFGDDGRTYYNTITEKYRLPNQRVILFWKPPFTITGTRNYEVYDINHVLIKVIEQ